MSKQYTNFTVKAVEMNTGANQLQLVMTEPSIFADSQGVEQSLILWSKKDGVENAEAIEQTQTALREQLGDPNIIFVGTNRDAQAQNPNEIVNWVASHVNAPIKLVTQNDRGYFSLGEGSSGSSQYGDSKYLDLWTGGPYTQKMRMLLYQALPQDLKDQYDNENGVNIKRTRSNYVNLEHEGVIVDVILTSANNYNERSTKQTTTRNALRQQILQAMATSTNPEIQSVAAKIQALPEDFALVELTEAIGGTNGTALASDNMVQATVPTLIKQADRITARFYVANDRTGYIYQTSPLKAKTTDRAFGLSFEFIAGDFTPKDLNNLLRDIPGLSTAEILPVLQEINLFDPATNTLTYKTAEDALHALRKIFNNREVRIQSLVSGPNMKRDPEKVGSRILSVGAYTTVPEVSVSAVVQQELPTTAPTPQVSAAVDMIAQAQQPQTPMPDPFAAIAAKNQPVAPAAPANPFAQAQTTPAPETQPVQPVNPFAQAQPTQQVVQPVTPTPEVTQAEPVQPVQPTPETQPAQPAPTVQPAANPAPATNAIEDPWANIPLN